MRLRPLEAVDRAFLEKHLDWRLLPLQKETQEGALAFPKGVAAEDQDRVIGAACLYPRREGEWCFAVLLLRPDFRKLGLEAQLILASEIQAERWKARRIGVWVPSDVAGEDSGARFWKGKGYRFREYARVCFEDATAGDFLLKELNSEP